MYSLALAITNAVLSEGMVDMETMEAASKSERRTPRALDVAAVAGVSTATVSRTFNAPEKVAPAIRERVLAAARALDWMPHAAGSALARRRSFIAGAVIPTLDNEIFAAHVVGGRDLLEAVLRGLVTGVGVGVVLPRELPVGLGDRLLVGVVADAEH